jgi:hypothetical protein
MFVVGTGEWAGVAGPEQKAERPGANGGGCQKVEEVCDRSPA